MPSSAAPEAPRAIPPWAWLAPLGTAVIWGVNIPVMKDALFRIHPFAFNALRLTLSVLALWALERAQRGRLNWRGIPWRRVAAVGLLSSFVYQLLFLAGMAHTSAGHTALIISSQPLWTALIASAARIERHGRVAWVGFGTAFLGTLLVVLNRGGAPGGSTVEGNLLVLCAALAWATSTVLSRPLLEHVSGTRLALLFTLVALPFHWLLGARHMGPVFDGTLGLRGLGSVVYSGIFSTGVAYALWNRGVRTLGPGRTAIFANLVPVVALLVAWVFLREVPLLVQVLGGALVLTGLLLARRAPQAEKLLR